MGLDFKIPRTFTVIVNNHLKLTVCNLLQGYIVNEKNIYSEGLFKFCVERMASPSGYIPERIKNDVT